MAKIIENMRAKYRGLIQKDDDSWKELSPREMYYFLAYCVRVKNFDWVKKVRETVRKRLQDKGYVYNEVLGWVFPEEIEQAGVDGDTVIDLDKFNEYQEYKKMVAEEDWKEEYRKEMEKKESDYLDQIVKDADEKGEGTTAGGVQEEIPVA